MTDSVSLPAVPEAALPAAVRNGSAAEQKTYKAALGFEKVLLGELVKEMTVSTPSLTEGPQGDAVRDAMTDALADAGGVGLAHQLFQTMQRSAA